MPAPFRSPLRLARLAGLLHFGAVDQTAKVWVNNQLVATHEGGYTAFSADVTDVLRASGPQELTVRAEDRTDIEPFPVGKQRNAPGGICYTPSSGIWQTVWLEPVPELRVERLDLTPDLTGVTVFPQVTGGADVVVVISANGTEVARASGATGTSVRVDIPSPRLWTPDDPHLYSLRVRLLDGPGSISDEVGSYAGLRTIGLVPDPQGRPRIALNGRVTFLHGPLDQGYWPDGISTAPTDALRFDLEKTKELGFNFVRKHVKVEPARWCRSTARPGSRRTRSRGRSSGRGGALRNGDAAAGGPVDRRLGPVQRGLGRVRHRRVAELGKSLDPTRLVIANSGVNCCFSRPDSGAGDVYDDYTYVGPGAPSVRDGRAIVDGEYGGLGLVLDDHRWPGPPNAYEMTPTWERLTGRYAEVSAALERVVAECGLSGAVYTQTTDVENEVNGLLTYDRRVVKVDPAVVAKCVRAVIELGSS